MPPDTDGSPGWLEIAVEVAAIDAETAADLLRQACPGGVAVELATRLDVETDTYVTDGNAGALVKGYLRPGKDADRLRRSLELALQAAPLQRAAAWREPQELADEDWRDSWKRHFGVQRVGRNLVIVPSWVEYEARAGESVVVIDPGMAFGTGQHPTTTMCLAALEGAVQGGERVLDLGCGSGILAIAAAKLGAGAVLALDNDPQAVKAARENVSANGVASAVDVKEGTLHAIDETRPFDLIVANISALTLERLAPTIVQCLAPSSRLIISGFLEEAVPSLEAAYRLAGLSVERTIDDGVWRCITGRMAADAG